MKNFSVLFFVFLLIQACGKLPKQHSSLDSRSEWLLKNEDKLNTELNKVIMEEKHDWMKYEVFNSATIVFTRNDTTILGDFAKLIYEFKISLRREYTCYIDTTRRKILILQRSEDLPCLVNADSILTFDSTKHFLIRKDAFSPDHHKL